MNNDSVGVMRSEFGRLLGKTISAVHQGAFPPEVGKSFSEGLTLYFTDGTVFQNVAQANPVDLKLHGYRQGDGSPLTLAHLGANMFGTWSDEDEEDDQEGPEAET